MKPNRLIPALLAAFFVLLLRTPPVAEADDDTESLIAHLGSENFDTRIKASKELKTLDTKQMLNLASQAVSISSAEAIVRILAEIDNRYSSASQDDVNAASEVLEQLSNAKRILLVEAASSSLQEHWQKRVTLALKTLEGHGAIIKQGTFRRSAMAFGGRSTSTMQILLTEAWTGEDAGVAAFERLAMLMGPVSASPIGVSVYLIAGHNLTETQQSKLTEIVGQNRIAIRSRVALGIVGNPVFSPGVIIDTVSKGSSAEGAGLQAGDLLLAIEGGTPEEKVSLPGDEDLGTDRVPLEDFQDLVAKLMEYDKGDVIKIRVIRNFKPYFMRGNIGLRIPPDGQQELRKRPEPEIVSVTLKGWEALGTE